MQTLESIGATMKNLLTILLFAFLTACETRNENQLIGLWCRCQHDGTYKEFKIASNYTTTSVSNFPELDYDDGISFYESYIQDSFLIVTKGLNVDLMYEPETLNYKFDAANKVTLESQFGPFQLTRITGDISNIDSTNFELWRNTYLTEFFERAELANCPDLRTEEEKQLPDLGEIEDDFEPLTPIGDSINLNE
ncbi:MAG: hypothetical protein ACJAZM_003241 [Cyclobacteriaceae bacterium]|jgi:hypothetical protein